MKAVQCPICWGTGKSYVWFNTCRGCNGKGWVEVHEEKTEIPKLQDYPIVFDDGFTVTWTWDTYSVPKTTDWVVLGTYS